MNEETLRADLNSEVEVLPVMINLERLELKLDTMNLEQLNTALVEIGSQKLKLINIQMPTLKFKDLK